MIFLIDQIDILNDAFLIFCCNSWDSWQLEEKIPARECDTDDEPGLDAREIATLVESLGYLPDMSCNIAAFGGDAMTKMLTAQ